MKKLALSSGKIHEFLILNELEAKDLYHKKGFTARQLANHFNIFFTPAFQKRCHEVLGTKNMGRGGTRLGAGNFAEGKKKKQKKANIFVFDFSDEIAEIIKSQKDFKNHKAFVTEAILWYARNNQNNEDTN